MNRYYGDDRYYDIEGCGCPDCRPMWNAGIADKEEDVAQVLPATEKKETYTFVFDPNESDIGSFLKSLGVTSDEVAEKLLQLGYEGFRNDEYENPIVKAIKGEFKEVYGGFLIMKRRQDKWGIATDAGAYWLTFGDSQIFDPPTLPDAIQMFMGQFDEGKFPLLDEDAPPPGFFVKVKRGE